MRDKKEKAAARAARERFEADDAKKKAQKEQEIQAKRQKIIDKFYRADKRVLFIGPNDTLRGKYPFGLEDHFYILNVIILYWESYKEYVALLVEVACLNKANIVIDVKEVAESGALVLGFLMEKLIAYHWDHTTDSVFTPCLQFVLHPSISKSIQNFNKGIGELLSFCTENSIVIPPEEVSAGTQPKKSSGLDQVGLFQKPVLFRAVIESWVEP